MVLLQKSVAKQAEGWKQHSTTRQTLLISVYSYNHLNWSFCSTSPSKMSKMFTALVTGANKGIGYEIVRLLMNRVPHAHIIMAGRKMALLDAARANLISETNDVNVVFF